MINKNGWKPHVHSYGGRLSILGRGLVVDHRHDDADPDRHGPLALAVTAHEAQLEAEDIEHDAGEE